MSISGNTRGWTTLTIAVLLVTSIATATARRYHVHHRHHSRSDIYTPPSRSVALEKDGTAGVSDTWPYVQHVIRYPGASGTTVLDAFSGRQPVISTSDCRYLDGLRPQDRLAWAYDALE